MPISCRNKVMFGAGCPSSAPTALASHSSSNRRLMVRSISHLMLTAMPPPSANSASKESRLISATARCMLFCRRSATPFTKQPWHLSWISEPNSSAASTALKPKPSLLLPMESCFCSMLMSTSSRIETTSALNKLRSCAFVSSRSFFNCKSQTSTSFRSCSTSSGRSFGLFNNLNALLCNILLFAAWTRSWVTSLPMPKNIGAQSVRTSISSFCSCPFCSTFCLMNILAHLETMRCKTCSCSFGERPKTPPT
mmetsp:Transcript_56827/g.133472  ORF Transcript_56827/g.133472 Transcript_56827/m.133472 type:complete len:252 (-) Transcript_56827:2683-3438(-)